MILIALHTIHGARVLRAPRTQGEKDKGDVRRDLILPRVVDKETGEVVRDGEFDPATYGIGDDEVKALIAAGSVRVKTREVPVEAEDAPAGGEAVETGDGDGDGTSGSARRQPRRT